MLLYFPFSTCHIVRNNLISSNIRYQVILDDTNLDKSSLLGENFEDFHPVYVFAQDPSLYFNVN